MELRIFMLRKKKNKKSNDALFFERLNVYNSHFKDLENKTNRIINDMSKEEIEILSTEITRELFIAIRLLSRSSSYKGSEIKRTLVYRLSDAGHNLPLNKSLFEVQKSISTIQQVVNAINSYETKDGTFNMVKTNFQHLLQKYDFIS